MLAEDDPISASLPPIDSPPQSKLSQDSSEHAPALHPDNDPASSTLVKEQCYTFLTTRLQLPRVIALLLTGNMVPDSFSQRVVLGQIVAPSGAHIKLAKFMILTYLLTYLLRLYVREDDTLEVDDEWRKDEFMAYYFLPTLLDIASFFTIGRLHLRRGVDSFNFAFPCALGACFMSWLGLIPALNTSFTKDSIEGWGEEVRAGRGRAGAKRQ